MKSNMLDPAIPEWVKDAVFYQIFPERFANGDTNNDPVNVVPWDSAPTLYNYMGGDLQGIIDKFDYLIDLGINAIYLNPVFWASSNHKYNPYDYYTIDPTFGTLDLFTKLLDLAHKNEVKVVLDGVFNHCGRGFFPFHDVLENREHSPYKDWFYISDFPVNAYGKHRYKTWGKTRKMPKLNIENPETRQYLLNVARYWIAIGADGWRLDAAPAIEDHDFWREFRQVVKTENAQAYIIGEVWEDGTLWLQGDQFDGITNYTLRGALLDFFIYKTVPVEEFVHRLQQVLSIYPWSATEAMYNLLGSHDTSRVLTLARGDINAVKLAALFQFTYPGVPAIYYGDEIGLMGGDDPDNRRTMPWDKTKWNTELRTFFQKLINIRKQVLPLRRGDWQHIFADNRTNSCAFLRRASNEVAIVAINNGTETTTLTIPIEKWNLSGETVYVDKISCRQFHFQSGELIIPDFPPGQGVILVPDRYYQIGP